MLPRRIGFWPAGGLKSCLGWGVCKLLDINYKRLYIFFCTLFLSLIVTLIISQFLYSQNHYKTRVSIQLAEVMTFAKIGWLWFLPLLAFIIDTVYNKWLLRLLIWISPIVIMNIYYRLIAVNQTDTIDFRLFAGYYYRYPILLISY